METFDQMIQKTVSSAKNRRNVISDGRHRCTYGELLEIFEKLDTFFSQSEICPQDCPIMRCGNTLAEALLLLGMLYMKRDFVLLPRLKGGKLSARSGDSGLPAFCQYKLSADVGPDGWDPKDPVSYIRLENCSSYKKNASILEGAEPGNVFLKTSGSTARPKLVMHSNGGLAGNAANCARRLKLNHSHRILIPVPIYHMYGLGAALLPGVIVGASINLIDNTNVIKYLDREKKFKPDISFVTPSLCDMLLRTRKDPYPYRLSVTAGDRIDKIAFENFEKKFGKLINLYGSTELGVIATSKLDDPPGVRANGIIETLPDVEIRPKDKASGQEMSEILCRHRFGFETYVDHRGRRVGGEGGKDHWFKTKDLGRQIGNGAFRVIGRTGHSINRNGILVAFAEVESLMEQRIEEVDRVVVLAGDEENYRGKKLVACCRLKPPAETDPQNIRSRCFAIMQRHMVPDEVLVVEEIPRLPNGKFDRKALAEFVEKQIRIKK